MRHTRLFLRALPLVALLTACSGVQQSSLPPDPGSQPANIPAEPIGAQTENVMGPGTSIQSSTISTNTASGTSNTLHPGALAMVPAHIPTWAYDEYWSLGARGTAAQARTYLSYAEGGLGNSKAVADCSGSGTCKSVFYFDSHFFYDTAVCGTMSPDARGIYQQSSEPWFVHLLGYSDSRHRLAGHYAQSCRGGSYTIPVYALNDLNAGVRAYFQRYLRTYAQGFDEFFLDDTSGMISSQFYGPGGGFCGGQICTTTQEMRYNSSVVAEHGALASALTHADGSAMYGVFNGINFTSGRPNDLSVVTSSSHFHGAVCEGCVISGGRARPSMFAPVLNAMAAMTAIPNAQLIELNDGGLAGNLTALIAARVLTTSMAWLGYSDGHTAVWPNLEQYTQNLAIFAENSIYPSSPIQTMRASVGASDLAVASGVYRREFRACYYNRAAIGPCAAVVNGSGGSIAVRSAWLQQTYGHLVQLIGGDIPNGGHISLTSTAFHPNVTYVGPGQGLLIVR